MVTKRTLSTEIEPMPENANAVNVSYRLLPADEWDRLREVVSPYGPMPTPETAVAAVAERDGHIVGALFLQLTFHMEPLVIEDAHVSFLRLQRTLHEALAGRGVAYYAFAGEARTEQILKLAGLADSHMTVWEGRIE